MTNNSVLFSNLFFSNHSKLGAILRECLGSLTCRAVVMIHISNSLSRYAETLAALQVKLLLEGF